MRKNNRVIPISEASSKWVRHRTWSIGVMVPSLEPLFWILRMLVRFESRITNIVPAIVLTVAGPLPVLIWSNAFITSSLKGPIFTINRKATTLSTNRTKNNNCIIFALSKKPNFRVFRRSATHKFYDPISKISFFFKRNANNNASDS